MWILKSEIPKLFPPKTKWEMLDEDYFDFIYIFEPLLHRDKSGIREHARIDNPEFTRVDVIQLLICTADIDNLGQPNLGLTTNTLFHISRIAEKMLFPEGSY